MDVGIYFDLRSSTGDPGSRSRLYGFALEMCEEAEALGCHSIWLTEHHLFDDGYLPQPLTFAAAIAARTRRVRIGTAIVIAPLHHPVELAEQATIVDVLSGGRLDLGLGAGYRVPEFELFGAEIKQRYADTDSCARELRELWRRITPGPALVALPEWNPERITASTFRMRNPGELVTGGLPAFLQWASDRELVYYDDDPTSTVSVLRSEEEGIVSHSIVVNGKPDGNLTADFVTMALTGLIPALMADSHERAFVVGYGTGVTVGELAALEGTRRVDVAEISQGVIDAAPFFDHGNQGASTSPKVRIRRGDAYRSLLELEDQYELIISEPSNPWVAGVEMLFAREYLEAARRRLAPGGVYAQWFHLYEVDNPTVQLVLRTYASVFPHVSVWFAQGTDLLLLGFDSDRRALDVDALRKSFMRADFRAGFGRAKIDTFAALLAHELLPLGVLQASPDAGAIHTLRHPILSDMAARAFFRGGRAGALDRVDPAGARVGARNSLLRRRARLGPRDPLPEPLLRVAADQVCGHERLRECTTLLAAWLHGYPGSERRKRTAASVSLTPELPVSLATVNELARLYGGPPAHDRPLAAQRLYEMTGQYVNYYHHAAPFDPAVIEARWQRCEGASCAELGQLASDWLGVELVAGPDTPPRGAQLPLPELRP